MRRTLRTSRQLRCSGIFSTVWLAGPLAPVSGLPGVVLALPPASLPGLLFSRSASDVSFQGNVPLLALLGSECSVIQGSGPHGTPAPLPAFLPGSACQGCPPCRPPLQRCHLWDTGFGVVREGWEKRPADGWSFTPLCRGLEVLGFGLVAWEVWLWDEKLKLYRHGTFSLV